MTNIIETPDVSEEIIDHEAPSPLDVPGLIRLLVVLSLIVGTFFLFGAQDLLKVVGDESDAVLCRFWTSPLVDATRRDRIWR